MLLNGKLNANYWMFNGLNILSFTIPPFLQMPEKYQNSKTLLEELFIKNKRINLRVNNIKTIKGKFSTLKLLN